MRYNKCIIICWLASLLTIPVGTTSAQEKSDVFCARFAATRSAAMNISVSRSDTIDLSQYLNTRAPIYSLSVDATIEQPREASFTRIVLEDTDGRDHLVLECDRFRNDTSVVQLREFCQETALLFGVTPARLKCYVAGDAHLALTAIHATDQRPERGMEQDARKQKEQHAAIRLEQGTDIVRRINTYNRSHRKMWKACLSNHSQTEYGKEQYGFGRFLSDDAYTANAQYYCSGIYEIGELERIQNTTRTSVCVDSFDWRNRHGHDWWVTSPKNQGESGYCTAFAAVGALEAMANLYYNRNLNYDLSEQDVAYYGNISYTNGGTIYNAVNYVVNNGVIDEQALPFQDTPQPQMPQVRPYGNELVNCTSHQSIVLNDNNEDQVKQFLIAHGPCVSGFCTGSLDQSHAMTLTGFGKVTANDMYTYIYQWSIDTVLVNGDPRIGKTFWKFKNSYYENGHDIYDHGHDGYMYIIFNNPIRMHDIYSLNIPISSRNLTNDSDILCEDCDGDGYFNWGIGPKPSHCPAWAPDDSDGDDSDRTKGHMDIYGFCDQLSTSAPQYQYIRNDTTLTVNKTWTKYLGIIRGATVTITAQQSFSNGTKLLLDNGATMILDGTTIGGSYIQAYAGSKIVLNNGAKITKPFEVPLGIQLIINNGKIE